jgi:hypothetical protein
MTASGPSWAWTCTNAAAGLSATIETSFMVYSALGITAAFWICTRAGISE